MTSGPSGAAVPRAAAPSAPAHRPLRAAAGRGRGPWRPGRPADQGRGRWIRVAQPGAPERGRRRVRSPEARSPRRTACRRGGRRSLPWSWGSGALLGAVQRMCRSSAELAAGCRGTEGGRRRTGGLGLGLACLGRGVRGGPGRVGGLAGRGARVAVGPTYRRLELGARPCAEGPAAPLGGLLEDLRASPLAGEGQHQAGVVGGPSPVVPGARCRACWVA